MRQWPAVSIVRRVRGGWLPAAREFRRWAAAALDTFQRLGRFDEAHQIVNNDLDSACGRIAPDS